MPKVENCFSDAYKSLFSLLESLHFMLTIPSDLSVGSAIYTYTHAYVCMYFIFPLDQSIFRYLCTLLQTFLFESNNIWSQIRPNSSSLLLVQHHLGHTIFHYFGCIRIFLASSLTAVFLSLLFVVFTPYCLCNKVMKNKLQ